MNQFIQQHKKFIGGIAACLLIAGVTMSFQNTPFGPFDKLDTLTEAQDTIPEKSSSEAGKMSIREFDKLVQHMDNENLKMQQELSNIDFEKIHKEIAASLDKVDFDKIKMNIDRAMKDVDFAKIENGIKTAMKEIDWSKMNAEVKASLQDAKKEMEKVDMQKIKLEIEKAKLEIEKSKSEIKKINVDEIMKNAMAGIAKAKDELRLTKDMFNRMENEGLINQADGFTIEYKNKTLLINGKKQPDSTRDKYLPYIKGDSFKISISKE